jgi:hypothetical protein
MVGAAGLRNGLSSEDNQTLFESSDIDQIIALVLRGLSALAGRGAH